MGGRGTRAAAPPRTKRDFHRLLGAMGAANLADGVGSIAYPWLASAVTRSPALIAGITIAQRLPWLLFSLPAGVLVDRGDRRRMMIGADLLRGAVTLVVAAVVVVRSTELADVDMLEGASTSTGLYALLVVATLLLGFGEVLRDNAGQTLTPVVVATADLERANGRMWAVERSAGTLLGPAIGSLLLLVAYGLPLFVGATALFAGAGFVAAMTSAVGHAHLPDDAEPTTTFGSDLREGVTWLWRHRVFRTMAIALGGLNLAGWIGSSTYVLFAQEVMGVGPLLFAIVGFGGAIGSVAGGVLAPRISDRLSSGTTLRVAVGGLVVVALGIALFPYWPVVMGLSILEFFCVTLWSVVALSLRQAVIPPAMLGRVNSVYRFVGWGAIPIGAAIGGAVVALAGLDHSRDWALRSVWWVAAAGYAVVLVLTASRLRTGVLERVRSGAAT